MGRVISENCTSMSRKKVKKAERNHTATQKTSIKLAIFQLLGIAIVAGGVIGVITNNTGNADPNVALGASIVAIPVGISVWLMARFFAW